MTERLIIGKQMLQDVHGALNSEYSQADARVLKKQTAAAGLDQDGTLEFADEYFTEEIEELQEHTEVKLLRALASGNTPRALMASLIASGADDRGVCACLSPILAMGIQIGVAAEQRRRMEDLVDDTEEPPMSPDWTPDTGLPSEKAVEAARRALNAIPPQDLAPETASAARNAANAMHDPALGLDRSVYLRAVVEALRGQIGFGGGRAWANFIEGHFTEGQSDA